MGGYNLVQKAKALEFSPKVAYFRAGKIRRCTKLENMKDNKAGQHIIYYDCMDTRPRRIKRPRNPNYENDIDRVFDDIRKMFEGDKKRYAAHNERRTRSGYRKGSGDSGASSREQRCMVKMIYSDDKKGHIKFLTNYMPQLNKE